MNVKSILQSLMRQKAILAASLLFAVGMAFLGYARPVWDDGPHLRPARPEQWRSEALLFITEPGFPWGSAVESYRARGPSGTPALRAGDTERLAGLATVYAQVVSSDEVRQLAGGAQPVDAAVQTDLVTYTTQSLGLIRVLPLLRVETLSATAAGSVAAANNLADAFPRYIARQQAEAGIPRRDRTLIEVVKRPRSAELVAGPSKSAPGIIFVAAFTLGIGLALTVDKIRRQGARRRMSPI